MFTSENALNDFCIAQNTNNNARKELLLFENGKKITTL